VLSDNNPLSRKTIRMQDPLKQGLKLLGSDNNIDRIAIRMQDPLKQGLKPRVIHTSLSVSPDSNARSIKTRIETI